MKLEELIGAIVRIVTTNSDTEDSNTSIGVKSSTIPCMKWEVVRGKDLLASIETDEYISKDSSGKELVRETDIRLPALKAYVRRDIAEILVDELYFHTDLESNKYIPALNINTLESKIQSERKIFNVITTKKDSTTKYFYRDGGNQVQYTYSTVIGKNGFVIIERKYNLDIDVDKPKPEYGTDSTKHISEFAQDVIKNALTIVSTEDTVSTEVPSTTATRNEEPRNKELVDAVTKYINIKKKLKPGCKIRALKDISAANSYDISIPFGSILEVTLVSEQYFYAGLMYTETPSRPIQFGMQQLTTTGHEVFEII